MDFRLTDKLDLDFQDGVIQNEDNGETTLLTAFFTDKRIKKQRGYWLDVKSSEIWKYEQSRLTREIARELEESAKEIAKELELDGVYDKIDVSAYVDGSVMTLELNCYTSNQLVYNRKFAI